MPIVTLTTDLGLEDYYAAAVKGAIYVQLPECNIVDISHLISPFNFAEAAYNVKNAYPDFPAGTVHIIGVSPELTKTNVHLAIKYKDQFFIGADNGMFSLLFDHHPDQIFELNLTQDTDALTFPTKDVFVKAACHLLRGGTLEVIGKRINEFKATNVLRPTSEMNLIKGSVIHIDHYGNVITNISRSLFKEIGKGRNFKLSIKKHWNITKISTNYNDVQPGNNLALFSTSGLLELAINKGASSTTGSSASLFGVKMNEIIRIEFEEI